MVNKNRGKRKRTRERTREREEKGRGKEREGREGKRRGGGKDREKRKFLREIVHYMDSFIILPSCFLSHRFSAVRFIFSAWTSSFCASRFTNWDSYTPR